MNRRRSPFSSALAPAVALALALTGTVPIARAAAPEGDFEQLIVEADGHVGAGRPGEAVSAYVEAFRAMPGELQVSGVGEFVVVAAGKSALDDFEAAGDRRSLEQARDILRAFVAAVKRADPATEPAPTEAAIARLDEIEARLREPEADAIEPLPAPVPAPEASVEHDLPPSPTDDQAPPDRSRLGLALAVSGGVVALAGVGLVIAGARQVPWIEGKLADEGWLPTDEGYDEQIADAERVRTLDLGLGAGALVLGVGLGVTGAVLMVRSKRGRQGRVALHPVLGPGRLGLGTVVRF